jgi:hypothetical protein
MLDRWDRILLVVVLVSVAGLGIWAGFFPRGFYDNFPGGGHAWVAADGPYNEHLVRDVGEANLGLAFIVLVALLRRSATIALAVAGGVAIAYAPHLVYHVRHIDTFPTTADKVGSIGALIVGVVAPVVLGVRIARRGGVPSTREANALT